jgi:DNA-binding transcriptional ArsR family regulator
MNEDEDRVFKALADASRRQLLDGLRQKNGQTLSELCTGLTMTGLAMTRQAVTKHLLILEEANLVVTAKEGREKRHFLNPVPINDIHARWTAKFEQGRLQALHNLKQALQEKEKQS